MSHYISQGRVETPIRRGGQLCCNFAANLLQYLCAKNYQNIMWFDKVIAKIKRVQFFALQCRSYDNVLWVHFLSGHIRAFKTAILSRIIQMYLLKF